MEIGSEALGRFVLYSGNPWTIEERAGRRADAFFGSGLAFRDDRSASGPIRLVPIGHLTASIIGPPRMTPIGICR